jgi:hypothetical protein
MGFENDIFISYAHIDNERLTEGQEGWISDFHRALKIRLAQLRGEKPKIWRDLKLQGNDYFGDTIVERFPKVALLVSVLSPRYVKSEWCVKELQEFCKAAEQTGGVRVADQSRIFKVVKTPVPPSQHPEEMQGLLGYEFYQYNQAGKFREFNKILGSDADKNFWEKLEDLAQDIHQLLEKIASNGNGVVEQTVKHSGTSIYLAETTFDLMNDRDKIKRELQQRGHIVLPDQPLPLYNPDFERMVRENLGRCQLSIHLISGRYGFVPEGAERSVVVIQNELAADYRRECPGFSRLVWMPVELKAQERRQEALLKSLQNDPNLLQTTLEELKTIIQDKLNPQPQPAEDAIAEDGPVRVYLICDQRDLEAIAPLDDHLFDQGFEVMRPLFEGDEAQVRQDHQDDLRLCDAVLIYYGNGSELWLRTKLRDLQKVAGYGRSKPMLAKAIYVTEPRTSQKQVFRTHEALVITNFGAFSPDLLEPFLTQIAQRQGGWR